MTFYTIWGILYEGKESFSQIKAFLLEIQKNWWKYYLKAYKKSIIDQNLKGIAHLKRLPCPWEVWNWNGHGRLNFWATPSKVWEKWYFFLRSSNDLTIIFGNFHNYKSFKKCTQVIRPGVEDSLHIVTAVSAMRLHQTMKSNFRVTLNWYSHVLPGTPRCSKVLPDTPISKNEIYFKYSIKT